MTIEKNETEKILKMLVGVYESHLNENKLVMMEDIDEDLLEICTKTMQKHISVHEPIENTGSFCGPFDDVDGISGYYDNVDSVDGVSDISENYDDLDSTVDFIAKTMEQISASHPGSVVGERIRIPPSLKKQSPTPYQVSKMKSIAWTRRWKSMLVVW